MKSSHWKAFAAGLALMLWLAACNLGVPAATLTPSAPVGDPARGQQAFAGTCAACHGAGAKGLPNLGKDLTSSELVEGLSDIDLIAFIKTGRPASDPANTTGVDMPPLGGNPALTEQDLADIVAYLRTLP